VISRDAIDCNAQLTLANETDRLFAAIGSLLDGLARQVPALTI
jgi:hypothetical protein